MARRDNARGRSAAGASEDDKGNGGSVAPGDAREVQLRDLAARDDWRDVVASMRLPDRDAHRLRVDVLRLRVFAATAIGTARARALVAQGRR